MSSEPPPKLPGSPSKSTHGTVSVSSEGIRDGEDMDVPGERGGVRRYEHGTQ